ncbi:methyltransferase domain-containing protein [Paraburkholderia fungorum]|uniref:class I SAM-dependent methyltransferase n=1 Tax=Paraburkholderia fungorum TaxID=134537 RepID=UPI0038BA318C
MKDVQEGFGYNERLFSGGFRSYLHLARFEWVSGQIKKLSLSARTVLELGCFDGKLIDFLPTEPTRYVGYDANWEGGLDIARERWGTKPNLVFKEVSTPDQMNLQLSDRFDVAVSMETLEHVPPALVDGYLEQIARHLDGYLFVTVPNEKGPLFLAKWTVKKLFSKSAEHYSLSELVNASLGRMDRVARNDHKGFDYSKLVRQLEKYFDVVAVSGHPFGSVLPCWCCFSIGIVAKPK